VSNFPDVFSLRGQVALITGGGTGIGLAIGRAMHAAGAQVALVGRRESELAAAAKSLGEGAYPIVHDITKLNEADALIAKVKKEIGEVTCLVNNAGIHLKKSALETTPEEFQTVLTTHVLGAHAMTRAVLPAMIARKKGTILFTASMASIFGIPMVVAYSAAKSAHLGMVRSLATELSPIVIRVNAIAPGWIDSEMSK